MSEGRYLLLATEDSVIFIFHAGDGPVEMVKWSSGVTSISLVSDPRSLIFG